MGHFFQIFSLRLALVATFAATAPAQAQHSPFQNTVWLKQALGFSQKSATLPSHPTRAIKVAVLDKGFRGFEKEIGRSLPTRTRYVPGPVVAPTENETDHGLRMAQILTDFVSDNGRHPGRLDLRLYNVFGYSNFKAAIEDLIREKVDLVLYSEVWEYGGNHEGKGFFNREVDKAIKAGVLWVNAAGNFALTTWNSPIETLAENWVRLPDQNGSLRVLCRPLRSSTCQLRAVLSWNDFKNDVDLGTNKDLDFALTDDLLNILQTSALRQIDGRGEPQPGESKYPREIISAEVPAGTFFLRVKNRSLNFSAKDRLRITLDGEGLELPSRDRHENLLNPADNPGVITVGASDSDRSSLSRKLGKPDLWAPSSLRLNDGNEFRGSSNSAALVAAALVFGKMENPRLTREQALSQFSFVVDWNRTWGSLAGMVFQPTGPGCFQEASLNPLPWHVQMTSAWGGVLVATTQGLRVMLPFDPLRLVPGGFRRTPQDMIVLGVDGSLRVYDRFAPIPSGAVELFGRPLEAGRCQAPFFVYSALKI